MSREAFELTVDGDYLKRTGEEYDNPFVQSAWEGYQRGRAAALEEVRVKLIEAAAKEGWAMKNEDPFEDAVTEIAVKVFRQLAKESQ